MDTSYNPTPEERDKAIALKDSMLISKIVFILAFILLGITTYSKANAQTELGAIMIVVGTGLLVMQKARKAKKFIEQMKSKNVAS